MLFSQLKRELNYRKNSGVALIITVIVLPAVIAVVGLCLDAGRAYGVRAKLYSAVDAASIAAARAIPSGESAASAAANKYFAANIPNDFFRTTPQLVDVTFGYNSAGDVTIDATATATPPTTFLQIVGVDTIPVTAQAQTIRRTVDLGFVVDNTSSLLSGSIGDVSEDVIERSKQFVENFNPSIDRLALIKYGYGAEVPVPFQSSRGFDSVAVQDEIDQFEFTSGPGMPHLTNSSEGFWQALDQLRNATNPASIRAVVFFNDGAPNTFAATFDFESGDTVAGSIRSADYPSGDPGATTSGLFYSDSVRRRGPLYYGVDVHNQLSNFPEFYNPHDAGEDEFLVINPSHPRRPVTDYVGSNQPDLYTKVNRISRNLVEDMAEQARLEGIFVFTLGLGSRLTEQSGPDNERGEEILYRMANDPRMQDIPALATDFRPDQLQGVYCHAVDENALAPCFEQIVEVLIRLTI